MVKRIINRNECFAIVNENDIHHNKNSTRAIEHEKQFEWIFYSLLNTINPTLNQKPGLKIKFFQYYSPYRSKYSLRSIDNREEFFILST